MRWLSSMMNPGCAFHFVFGGPLSCNSSIPRTFHRNETWFPYGFLEVCFPEMVDLLQFMVSQHISWGIWGLKPMDFGWTHPKFVEGKIEIGNSHIWSVVPWFCRKWPFNQSIQEMIKNMFVHKIDGHSGFGRLLSMSWIVHVTQATLYKVSKPFDCFGRGCLFTRSQNYSYLHES